MLIPTLGLNFIGKGFALIFISFFDFVAYLLLSAAYSVFLAVSNINIFGTSAGAELFDSIVERFYMVISIAMIFVFAYQLIMMIINPEGDTAKASTSLVKDTVISVLAIAVLPLIFDYMHIFQKHVIQDNTIPAIILGGNPTPTDEAGGDLSVMVFMSFFHPVGTSYSTFIDEAGNLSSSAKNDCTSAGASGEICDEWIAAFSEYKGSTGVKTIAPFSKRGTLRSEIDEEGGMEYLWILSTAAALAVAWFFFSYSIDIGTRAVKLGFLQLIAPVPLIMRIFPKSKGMFDAWINELKKTYIEIFIRLAVIFFIVYLCQMVPILIDAIFSSTSGAGSNALLKGIATVCLILGLLKFAKEAPELFKKIFSSGPGGLFEGVNLKPGMKKRIESNDFAMKGIGAASGIVSGVAGAAMQAGRNRWREVHQGDGVNSDVKAGAAAAASVAASIPKAIMNGARTGFTNAPKNLTKESMGDLMSQSMQTAQAGQINASNKFRNNMEEIKAAGKHVIEAEGVMNTLQAGVEETFGRAGKNLSEAMKPIMTDLTGAGYSNKALQTAKQTSEMFNQVLKRTEKSTEAIGKAEDDAKKKIMAEGKANFLGKEYTSNAISKTAAGKVGNEQLFNITDKSGANHLVNSKGHVVDRNGNRLGTDIYKTVKDVTDEIGKASKELKNEYKAEALNKSGVRNAAKTQLSTINEYLSKHMGDLGANASRDIAEIVSKNMGSGVTLDQFMTQVTDLGPQGDFNAKQAATISALKSFMDDTQNNITTAQQQKAEEKKDK